MIPEFVWKDFVGNPKKEAMEIKYEYMNNDKIFENISKLLFV
jgi:hypothetical protein